MDAIGWIVTLLIWLIGISSLFCLSVVIIAIAYPAIVLLEELVLHRKSTFLLFDVAHPERMHFFVDMPNEVVVPIVDLGHNLHEFLINSDHKDFAGLGTNKERWKIVERTSSQPQQYVSNVEEWYRNYIHKATGRMYIGFYPFRKVSTKEITKLVRLPEERGDWFESATSTSNHLRIRPFEWNFKVTNAEVSGLIPTNVYGVLLFECINPYESWRGIDAWDSQLTNAPVSTIRNILKNWSVEDVLASDVEDVKRDGETTVVARRLEEEAVKKLNEEYGEAIFGFKVIRIQIFDVVPNLTPEQLEKARAGFFARRMGEAYKITQATRGEGDAGYLKKISDQMRSDPEHGRFITEQDTKRKMAEGGKSTVIFDNAGGTTPPLEKTLMLLVDRLDKLAQPDKQDTKK